MTFWVGFDVGKTFHWVSVLDDAGEVVLSRRVEATEQDLEAACSQIAASFSNAITLVKSAKTNGAATIEKPISSSDTNDFGYVKRIIAPSL